MKIRNGFVSNSSSSSFCILGTKLTAAEKKELWDDEKYDYKLVKGLEYNSSDDDDGDVIVGLSERMYEEYGITRAFTREDFDKVEKLLRKQFGPDRELDVAVWYGMVYS